MFKSSCNIYAATVSVPAAVPIATELVIVDAVFVPLSLIVPLFNDTGFATTFRTSFALVAALLAAIALLFYNLEEDLWPAIKSFLVFLNRIPEYPKTPVHNIPVDPVCVKELHSV